MTKHELNELFTYKNGKLFWNLPRKGIKAGLKAGSVLSNGYESICINQKRYYSHRLIFMMFHGYLPKEIDHIDGNPINNKIENLRESNRFQNMQNIKLSKTSTSGYKNVYWHKSTQKWKVEINVNKKRMVFGNFDDLELADLVAQEARNKYHKEFARHI